MAFWKHLLFKDILNIKDNIGCKTGNRENMGIKGSYVVITDSVTGEVLFKGCNSMLIPGSIFTARRHFPEIQIPNCSSYNSILNLDYTLSNDDKDQEEQIWLFCVGTDGAEIESTQIKPVSKTMYLHKDYMIPFRYVDSYNDLNIEDRQKYVGRKDIVEKGKIAYYFKTFTNYPTADVKYADGTAIDTDLQKMYASTNVDPHVRVEIRFKVEPEDCREWFKVSSSGGLLDARVNTLSLCSAWKSVNPSDGFTYYQNIQPVTKLNFSTELLDDPDKGLDIRYFLYY